MPLRPVGQLKQKLYNKIYKQSVFTWFVAQTEAGAESVINNIIPPQYLAPQYNLAYGILWGQIIGALINAVNATLSPASLTVLTQNTFNSVLQAYDSLVQECQGKLEIAEFDITSFDASGYAPGYAILATNSYCSYVKNTLLSQLQNLFSPPSLPALTLQSSVAQQIQQQAQAQKQQQVTQAQPLIGIINNYINYVNSVIDGGFALDIAWWDRSVFAPRKGSLNYLGNGVKVQNASEAFGFVLDYSYWDFNQFLPTDLKTTFPLVQVFLVSLFANLFLQRVYDPSKGGVNIQYSIPAEFYIEHMSLMLSIFEAVRQHYSNVWKANMIANAIIQLAWYNYKGSFVYSSGAKYVYNYNEFLNYWTQNWLSRGLTQEDLAFARRYADKISGGLKLLGERKVATKNVYVQNYKPFFNRKQIVSGALTWG